MRENKSGKSPQDWLPLYFDKMQADEMPHQTEEEIKELQDELAFFNSLPPEQLWGNRKAED
jgi:hypothetical protein